MNERSTSSRKLPRNGCGDHHVRVLLGPKEVASHPWSWSVGERIADPRHEDGMREEGRRARAAGLPDTPGPLGPTGKTYFGLLAEEEGSVADRGD